MPVSIAFFAVVAIWSTTPLAIHWSGVEVGFLFGVAARMVIGLGLALAILAVLRRSLRFDAKALLTYAAAGLGLWGGLTTAYWGAQLLSSGLMSVLFGLTPLVTGIMAALWLNERAFSRFRVLGMLVAFAGLALLFSHGLGLGKRAVLGIGVILFSVVVHSLSAVLVKRMGKDVPALDTTLGSLLVATPLFVLGWLAAGGHWPAEIPARAAGSILYLAVFGSLIGFVLYYYVLQRAQASEVAMITLLTPMFALWLGHWLNAEQLSLPAILASASILGGLAIYHWGESLGLHWQRARSR
jgi:drug/metabolite transporter (DMT)-like permease